MELTAKILEKAIIFATLKHSNQVRKGDGRPYILHPLSVLQTLLKIKKSKNKFLLAVASVLHDTVEDCDVTLDEIAKEFGYHVAGLVEELTSKKEDIVKSNKSEYLLNKMMNMSNYALCIKLCDRLDNLNDMDEMSDTFRKKYCDETRFILNGLEKRNLTNTHKKIIKLIEKILKKH
jgi:(p)ppGpp synthase/HD superfamily hydrolase